MMEGIESHLMMVNFRRSTKICGMPPDATKDDTPAWLQGLKKLD